MTYGFGFDPEVPAGYQDADIEMAELAAQADEEMWDAIAANDTDDENDKEEK